MKWIAAVHAGHAGYLFMADEIGMGDNIYLGDRNGVRTPMQWNGGWNGGFFRGRSRSGCIRR